MFSYIKSLLNRKDKLQESSLRNTTYEPAQLEAGATIISQPDTHAPVSVPPEAEPTVKNSASGLYIEFVEPYKRDFIRSQSLHGVIRLIDVLEEYGHFPSVHMLTHVSGYGSPQREVLARISLRDHSCRVARLMVSIQKGRRRELFGLMPMYIAAGLAHDVGKIHTFGGSEYSTGDHPVIGARIIRACFSGCNVSWIDDVVRAVLNHHRDSSGDPDRLLRRADRLARGEELVLF
jgi:hypothetical protein